MKIFISGGAGFIGKWIIEKLNHKSRIVVLDSLDKQSHPRQRYFSQALKERAVCIKSDIRNIPLYKNELEGSDIILHLASQTGTGQSMYEISKYIQHNVDGTAKLLEAISLLKHKPKRIILTSSRAVYGEGAYKNKADIFFAESRKIENLRKGKWEIYNGKGSGLSPLPMRESHNSNPVSVYGFTKLWQEQLVQSFANTHNIDYLIFRLQNVYGPKQEINNPYTNIISVFTNSIFQNKTIELFEDGNMNRDFVYVEDVASLIAKSVYCKKAFSKIINIGSGVSVSLRALVLLISSLTKKKPHVKISGRFRIGDIRYASADIECLKEIFKHWTPTSLEEGLTKYLGWYITQKSSHPNKLELSLKEMEQKGLLKKSN